MKDIDKAAVRERAVALLARREHSRLELGRKLQQKGFDPTLTHETLAELAEENLLSDERYAEALAHNRVNNGKGPVKIRTELTQNGVDEILIEKTMAALSADWTTLAADTRQKRFKSPLPVDYSEKARQARFLSGRGFSSETIWRVLGSDD